MKIEKSKYKGFKMVKCEICGKEATANCAQCGMPLCDIHIGHGIQFRSNSPVVNCPNCQSNIKKLSKKTTSVLSIGFIILAIIIMVLLFLISRNFT